MSAIEAFRSEVERFLSDTGMTPTTLGKSALRDPNFVFDLRDGRIPNLSIVDRVQTFMRGHAAQSEPFSMVNGEAA